MKSQINSVQRRWWNCGEGEMVVSKLNRFSLHSNNNKKKSTAGDHYWFIHSKQFLLARCTWRVGVCSSVSSFYTSRVWVWVREAARASARWVAETHSCAQFSRRNTMKTFSCAPRDCFWPQTPCRRKHKPTSIPLCVCWNVCMFFLSAATVAQHAKYYLIKTPLCKTQLQPICAPTLWQGHVTNCLAFIIDTAFNVLRGFLPVLAMVTTVENEPGLCVFQSARPCPGQRCGRTTVHRKWSLVCLSWPLTRGIRRSSSKWGFRDWGED